jgi:hypothetical protein
MTSDGPYEPGDEPAHTRASTLQEAEILANDGYVVLAEILEGTLRLVSLKLARDQTPDTPCWIAGSATPGSGPQLRMTDDASPTTNTLGTSGTCRPLPGWTDQS